jgi:SpoVK/Ycf46/Vps4 family AAA+-type ATPase
VSARSRCGCARRRSARSSGQRTCSVPGKLLRRMIDADAIMSLILHGPPGTGKTTLAEVIAGATNRRFVRENAASVGVKRIREIIDEADRVLSDTDRRTILFLDEIHRFTKSQQDVLLGDVERGLITLIGATTENPLFSVNSALISAIDAVQARGADRRRDRRGAASGRSRTASAGSARWRSRRTTTRCGSGRSRARGTRGGRSRRSRSRCEFARVERNHDDTRVPRGAADGGGVRAVDDLRTGGGGGLSDRLDQRGRRPRWSSMRRLQKIRSSRRSRSTATTGTTTPRAR